MVHRRGGFAVWAVVSVLLACGNRYARSDFEGDAGAGGEAGEAGAGPSRGGSEFGGIKCSSDEQCDDGIECTNDSCDLGIQRCLFQPIHDRCDDGVYCNGFERCRADTGCGPGQLITCSDDASCTIDRCVEETRMCQHSLRDADGDGDPTWNCSGTDCDDNDALVNGQAVEVCGNQRDDDCDGAVDEEECDSPLNDRCTDALPVTASGSYEISLRAATEDAASSCLMPGEPRRDAVVALVVPEGDAQDIAVTALAPSEGLGLFAATACTNGEELGCAASSELVTGAGYVSRLTLRAVEPGAIPLYVSGLRGESVELRVTYSTPTPAEGNETCGNARPIEAGATYLADLNGATRDLPSQCSVRGGELVYSVELEDTSDLSVLLFPQDDYGVPTISLRSEGCRQLADELDCRMGANRLFARALPAGKYFVALGSAGPANLEFRIETARPSQPEPSQDCDDPATTELGQINSIDLGTHTNGVLTRCLPGGTDASFEFQLEQRSDVLVVERVSAFDTGAASIVRKGCDPATSFACEVAQGTPARARADLPPGKYVAVAESRLGSPVELSVLARPHVPDTAVAFADGCDDAVTIPETGGRFSGNTSNAYPDFEASCDYGGVPTNGARDQLLKLTLSSRRRVVLDASGSRFSTIVVVREGSSCPGRELELGCAPGRSATRSYLDLTLDPGEYYVQIDGFNQAEGPWQLDVFTY